MDGIMTTRYLVNTVYMATQYHADVRVRIENSEESVRIRKHHRIKPIYSYLNRGMVKAANGGPFS